MSELFTKIMVEPLSADPQYWIREACCTTEKKEAIRGKERSYEEIYDFFVNQFIAKHSVVRYAPFVIKFKGLRTDICMQLIRHTKGFVQPEVSSSRPDWNNGAERLPSDKSFSDCMLMMTPDAFMSMCNQRLCTRAMKETIEVVRDVVHARYLSQDPFFTSLALCSVPNCILQLGCPELKSCHYIDEFYKINKLSIEEIVNIKNRY